MFDENKIIGYGLLRGWDEGYDIPSLGIMIDSSYRGKGLSYQMMEYLHKAAKEKNASQIRLTVYKQNNKAISLYKKLGYTFSEKNEEELIGITDI